MFLPLMNPLCSLEIILGRILASLWAMTLVMIFNLKFTRAIGLYWSIVSAHGLFGINIRELGLKLGGSQPVWKNSMTASHSFNYLLDLQIYNGKNAYMKNEKRESVK